MISSMTCFGRTEESLDNGQVIWEIRSVNHRYLEVNVRTPEDFRSLETQVRQLIGKKLKRGKVDCQLRFESADNSNDEININSDQVNKLLNAAIRIGGSIQNTAPINVLEILRWPGVIVREEINLEKLSFQILDVLEKTLNQAVESRLIEGQKIKSMILERCDGAMNIVNRLNEEVPSMMQQLKEKLIMRIDELCEEVDNERLEQEIAYLAQKYDIAEELDRLNAHIIEVQRVLEKTEPVGRRLDFLMQEMNREANTLGSKATDLQFTNASVELKVLIEQMREQIQNIE